MREFKALVLYLALCFPSLVLASNVDSLIQILNKSQQDQNRVDILNKLAEQLQYSDANKAKEYALEAKELSLRLNFNKGLAQSLYEHSNAVWVLGDIEQSISSVDSSIFLAERLELNELLSNALNLRAKLFVDRGQMEDGRDYYNRGLDLARIEGNLKGQVEALTGLGYVLRRDGKYKEAHDIYLEGLALSESSGDPWLMILSYSALGIIYELRGQIDKGLDYYLKALRMCEETGNELYAAKNNTNVGSMYFIQKNYELAEEYALRGLKSYIKLRNRYGIGFSYHDLANIYKNKMELDTALTYYNRAIKVRKELGDKRGLSFSYFSMGNLHKRKNDLDSAIYYHKLSLDLRRELDYQSGISSSIRALGVLYMLTNKYDEGISYLKESLDRSLEVNSAEGVYEAYGALADGYEKIGDYRNAYLQKVKYTQYRDSVFNVDQNEQFAKMQTEYETEKKEKQILELEVEKTKITAQRNLILGGGMAIGVLGFMGFRFNQVRKERNDKKEFAEALIFAQEEERKRIARDLHDGVGQSLLLIKKQLETNTKITKENQGLISQTLEEVRSISQDLHPYQLEKFGITAAINDAIFKIEKSTDLFITKEIENIDNAGLSDKSQINLFRTIQEALSNIVKHAEATAAKVTIGSDINQIKIIVQDNGKGFDKELAIVTSKSLGLRTMYERMSSIGGHLEIRGGDKKGTIIELTIPKG